MNKIEYLSIPTKYEIKKFEADDRFLEIDVKFIHEGVNVNMSNFSKSAIDNAKDTLKNIPILAYIQKKEDGEYDFKGHEMELSIEKDDNGNLELKTRYLEVPIGIVPETNDYSSVVEDGRTYYRCKAYIWKEYANEALDIIERDIEKSVSMEIRVDDGAWSDELNAYDIKSYKYLGITILGKDVLPGIENASMKVVEQFSDTNKQVFAKMVEEINEYLNANVKGGADVEDIKNKIPQTEEQVKEKFKSIDNKTTDENNEIKDEFDYKAAYEAIPEKFKKVFELSHDDIRWKLYEKLESVENADDEWYYISEVYDNYFVYENYLWGSSDERKIFKQGYIKTDNDVAFEGERVRLYEMKLTQEEKDAIDTMRNNYSLIEQENSQLKEQLSTYQLKEREEQIEAIFSQFEGEFTEDEIADIKENCKEFTLDELEKELFALLGRKKFSKFSKVEKKDKPIVTIKETSVEKMPYGSLSRYFNE